MAKFRDRQRIGNLTVYHKPYFSLGVTANLVLHGMQDKINVSVYFILTCRMIRLWISKQLVGYKEIKSIDFVSKEDALVQFKQLSGANPLYNRLWMKSVAIRCFPHWSLKPMILPIWDNCKSLGSSTFSSSISRINYEDNKSAISGWQQSSNLLIK